MKTIESVKTDERQKVRILSPKDLTISKKIPISYLGFVSDSGGG